MRNVIIIFLLGVSVNCLATVNVVIRLGPDRESKLMYFKIPFKNGDHFMGNVLKMKPDARGVIRLKIDLESPGMLYFGNPNAPGESIEVYLEPDKDIAIDIGREIVFNGLLKTENTILYNFRRRSHSSELGKKVRGISSATVFFDTLMGAMNKDLMEYKALEDENNLSPPFTKFITENIRIYHYYFGIYFLNQEKFRQYCYGTPIKNDSLINSDWGMVWNKLAGDEILNYGTTISAWFTANIFQYIYAYRYAFLKESRVPVGPDNYGAYIDSLSSLADRHLSTPNREVFIPQLIYSNTASGTYFYVPEMVELYNRFKSEFPDSPTIPLLAPKIDEIIRYNAENIPDLKSDSKVIFMDDTGEIGSFDELLKPFKNKVVFIDIWATWCGPCIEEFSYYSGIRKLQEENKNFAVLYISRDKMSDENRWRKFVKKRALVGYHLIPNASLEKDLHNLIQWNAIPRYVIVDKTGQIVNSNAAAPSTGEELINELSEYLSR